MTFPSTMKALQVSKFGGPEVLERVELPVPSPRVGQVLIKVEAIGLNFADMLNVAGQYMTRPALPFVPGMEFSGTVVALGEGVTHLQIGQRVAALGGSGFAEYATTSAAGILPLPSSLSAPEAAAIPISYYTAYFALGTLGQAKAGETVLIQAAAGALGTASIQLAKQMGLKVMALASSESKLELTRALGADVNLLNGRADLLEAVLKASGGEGVDIVLEVVGGEKFVQSVQMLRSQGRVMVIGSASGGTANLNPLMLMGKNVTVTGVWLTPLTGNAALMREASEYLVPLLSSGRVKPQVGEVFSLENAGKAFEFMSSRASVGKVIIQP
jgi:NADPH:quinone reductase